MSDHTSDPRLAHQVIDSGQGPWLFLVHGMLSSRDQWLLNLDALKSVARLVVFDLWGHGESPSPDDERAYQVEAIIGQFEQVRERLGAEQVLLGGQSLGAGLTLRYSMLHPDRVRAQFFTNSMSALSAPDAFGNQRHRAQRVERIRREGAAALREMPFHPRHARRLPPDIHQTLVARADAVNPEAFAHLSLVTGPQLSVRADLHRIGCPTLLTNGLWEKSFQPLRDFALQSIPGCEVADLEGGHAVNIEQPQGFNEAVTEFVRRQTRERGG